MNEQVEVLEGQTDIYEYLPKSERRDRLSWTNDEDIFISENAGILTAREIGEKLGRTERAVRNRAQVLFISLAVPKLYQLYEKGAPVFSGTLTECARYWNVSKSTIHFYATKTYAKRVDGFVKPDMARIAVRL